MSAKTKAAPNKEAAKSQKQAESNANPAAAQRERILAALRVGSLTTLQARRDLDCLHPAARVMELREQGYGIATVWTWDFSTQGVPHRVAQYVLQAEVRA